MQKKGKKAKNKQKYTIFRNLTNYMQNYAISGNMQQCNNANMKEYAQMCRNMQNMQKKICVSIQKYTKICVSIQKYTKICKNKLKYAK